MSTSFSSYFNQQFFGSDGSPLAGGRLEFYSAGSNVAAPVYASDSVSLGSTVLLKSDGRPNTQFRLDTSLLYKIELYDSVGALVESWDSVGSGGGAGASTDLTLLTQRVGSLETEMEGSTDAIGLLEGEVSLLIPKVGDLESWKDATVDPNLFSLNTWKTTSVNPQLLTHSSDISLLNIASSKNANDIIDVNSQIQIIDDKFPAINATLSQLQGTTPPLT